MRRYRSTAVFGTNHLARKLLLVALCNLTFALGCDSRLYDPPKTLFFKTAITGALSSGDIILLEAQPDGTIDASYIDMHDNDILISQLVSVNDRVFAWVQYDSTVPSPVPAPKGIYELSLTDYSLSRLPIDLPGSSPAQQTGLLSAGDHLFAATGDGLWEILEDEDGVIFIIRTQ
jgi:hypothetical protein